MSGSGIYKLIAVSLVILYKLASISIKLSMFIIKPIIKFIDKKFNTNGKYENDLNKLDDVLKKIFRQ